MSREISGFRTRSENQKDETLRGRYGRIGIQAVAAAQSALHRCGADERQALQVNATSGDRARR